MSVEGRNRTNTGKITAVKTSTELGQKGENLFAIIKARQQVVGIRSVREIWYPLKTPTELHMKEGDKVIMRTYWHKLGLGRGTTSTLELVKPVS